jgi:hypothetical protein
VLVLARFGVKYLTVKVGETVKTGTYAYSADKIGRLGDAGSYVCVDNKGVNNAPSSLTPHLTAMEEQFTWLENL